MALKNLDGKAAQKTAIQELVALLTKVDDLFKSAAALNTTNATDDQPQTIDIDDSNLAAAEVTAYKSVVMKFNALEMALAGRSIDTAADTDTNVASGAETAGVDADLAALVKLENDDSNWNDTNDVHHYVSQLAVELTTQLGEGGGTPTAAATALLTELKTEFSQAQSATLT